MKHIFLHSLLVLAAWVLVVKIVAGLGGTAPAHDAPSYFPEEVVIEDDGRIVVGSYDPLDCAGRRY